MVDHLDLISGQQAADLGPDVTVRLCSETGEPVAGALARSAGVGHFLDRGVGGPATAYRVLPGVQEANGELDVARGAIDRLNAHMDEPGVAEVQA